MPLPKVGDKNYGDMKKLSDLQMKYNPSAPAPDVPTVQTQPQGGRPQGSPDSYMRRRTPPPKPEPTGELEMSPQEEALLSETGQSIQAVQELIQMASQPGANQIIKQMAQIGEQYVRDQIMNTRQNTQWLDLDYDGIPDYLE